MTQPAQSSQRYRTIVADPPWPYADRAQKRSLLPRTVKKDGTTASGVSDGYEAMALPEIAALRPPCESDAHLYLWTTNAFMVPAHEIAELWGFKVKTICTWVKTHQDDRERVSMKTGYYFRGATEHFLFCVRGSLPLRTRSGMPTAYLWPRLGRHSQKPEAFYDLVEAVSPRPYLEMFARRNRLGWDTWGNEALNHVDVTA